MIYSSYAVPYSPPPVLTQYTVITLHNPRQMIQYTVTHRVSLGMIQYTVPQYAPTMLIQYAVPHKNYIPCDDTVSIIHCIPPDMIQYAVMHCVSSICNDVVC